MRRGGTTRPSPDVLRRVRLSLGSRARRPPRRRRWSSARSAPITCSRSAAASSMRSAIPWCTRTAVRRCRRCPGSGTIPRPSGRSRPRTFRYAGSGEGADRRALSAGAKGQVARASVPTANSPSMSGQENADESVRRSLENCGATLGVACMTVAVDDVFVVPVPTLMKATGFFRPPATAAIVADARDDVARKLAGASSGWNAVAVGTAGRPGLGLKAASEQDAINDALGNCAKRDSDCHVIAIGPFVGRAENRRGVTSSSKLPRTSRKLAPPPDRRRAGTAPRDRRRDRAAPSASRRIPRAGRCAASADRSPPRFR